MAVSAQVGVSKKEAEYTGVDAGCLIYSVGTVAIGMRFAFPYARANGAASKPDRQWSGTIAPRLGGAVLLKIKDPDFTGEESGHVVVRCLPSGTYAVGSFEFYGSTPGVGSTRRTPSRPISMPFTIRSDQGTYIGTFLRAPSLGTPMEEVLGAAGYFIVADRSKRDLPIATSKFPAGMTIPSEVIDVATFGLAALRNAAP